MSRAVEKKKAKCTANGNAKTQHKYLWALSQRPKTLLLIFLWCCPSTYVYQRCLSTLTVYNVYKMYIYIMYIIYKIYITNNRYD